MAILKRILLFFMINLFVIMTLSFILNFFNIRPYLTGQGINYDHLLIFCLVWGMGGSLISLFFSRSIAKHMMGVKLIDCETAGAETQKLCAILKELCHDAGLPALPQLGIYESKEVNAFATGPSKTKSLIALSSGLVSRLGDAEIKAIMAHEISHIASGDMVTMTLLQGIVNAFVMFLARILAHLFAGSGDRKRSSYMSYYLFTMLFELIFMLLGSLVVAFFSRQREFQADRGGAYLAGKENMIEALSSLRVMQHIRDIKTENKSIAAFKISTPLRSRLFRWLASHPPLEERIERLKAL